MTFKRSPELLAFFSTSIAHADPDGDEMAVKEFLKSAPAERRGLLLQQVRQFARTPELPLDELGSEANRWFGDSEEARVWLESLVQWLSAGDGGRAEAGATESVKDSNGATLVEGDSVQVIKDLKVKGGSSDLKRGTLIKKIHLIGDPEAIECRVDGSTLVLKTCFLKKA